MERERDKRSQLGIKVSVSYLGLLKTLNVYKCLTLDDVDAIYQISFMAGASWLLISGYSSTQSRQRNLMSF